MAYRPGHSSDKVFACCHCYGRHEAGYSPKSALKLKVNRWIGSAKGHDPRLNSYDFFCNKIIILLLLREWEAADEFEEWSESSQRISGVDWSQ